MREEFEAFARGHDVWLYRDEVTGEYEFAITRLLYKTWLAALAYQDELIRATYADAAEVCGNSDIVDAADSQYAQLGDARATLYSAARDVFARTPDDARRKFEEMRNE